MAVAFGALLVLTRGQVSHAAGGGLGSVLVDTVHQIAADVWVGGACAFAVVMPLLRRERSVAARPGPLPERTAYLFRCCLTRPPTPDEQAKLVQFFEQQKQRFEKKELDAAAVAGPGKDDVNERAAWTALARALFNLDEAITKE